MVVLRISPKVGLKMPLHPFFALPLLDRGWKSKKIYKSLRAHDGPVVGCITHPLEASKVATCSWDGLIKYWD